MTETERTAVLVLSQHGAKTLKGTIENVLDEYEDIDGILAAIVHELDEQIEKKAKKSKSKKRK